MEDTKYLKITENNDWEGEQWIHYVKVNGNEAVIPRIIELVKKYGREFGMSCAKERKSAEEVDTKCAKRTNGYIRKWGKNDRQFTLGQFANVDDEDKFLKIFYKGQIRDLGKSSDESELLL